MSRPVVEAAQLVKRYRSRPALDGLSFTAGRGQITALLGPNGAGKTTTIEICEGFRRADAGQIEVLGQDPARDARELKIRIGVMLQSGGIPSSARPAETLRVFAAFYAHPLDPDMLLERLGIPEVADVPYRRLSGGQRQRLSLALAVVGRPELVFLDEPTAGLDPHARHAAWELVEDLRNDGVSVILTTHDMNEAERLAEHVVIVDAGKAVASGSPYHLTSTGAERQLRFRARPGLDVEDLLIALPVGSVVKESPPSHYIIEGDVGPELLATVTAWCASHDVMTTDLRIESRTLEDVFLEVTGRELAP